MNYKSAGKDLFSRGIERVREVSERENTSCKTAGQDTSFRGIRKVLEKGITLIPKAQFRIPLKEVSNRAQERV